MRKVSIFDCTEFIEAYKANGKQPLTFDPENYKQLQSGNSKGKKNKKTPDVTYLPIEFNDKDRKTHKNVRFTLQAVLAAKVKPNPHTEPENVKHVDAAFRKITYEELLGGDYVPKNLLITDKLEDDIMTQYMKFQSNDIDFDAVKSWLKSNMGSKSTAKKVLKKIDTITDVNKFKEWLKEFKESSKEEQEIENKEFKKYLENIVEKNNEFVNALKYMDDAFNRLGKRLIEMEEKNELPFSVQKDPSKEGQPPAIKSIKQSQKVDGVGRNKTVTKFDNPIYRLKLSVHKESGRVGIYIKGKDEIIDTVFDMKKSNKKNGWKAVPAKVVEKGPNGKLVEHVLTKNNVHKFMTYKSLIVGELSIREAVLSMSGGISSKFELSNIKVLRHKPQAKNKSLDAKTTQYIRRDACSSDDEDDDIEDMGEDIPQTPSDEEKDEEKSEHSETSEGEPPDENSEEDEPKKKSKKKKK